MSKICMLLTDNTHKLLDNNLNSVQVIEKMSFLIKAVGLPKKMEISVIIQNARDPRLYGRSKIHKQGVPLCPIARTTGSATS